MTVPPRPLLLASEALLPPARQSRSKHKRAKLLAAGLELFRQKGYEATSVEEISARAEVAVGGFYQHFANKRQLLVTLMDKLLESLSQLDLVPKVATKAESLESGSRESESLESGSQESGSRESPAQPGRAEVEEGIPDESEYPPMAVERERSRESDSQESGSPESGGRESPAQPGQGDAASPPPASAQTPPPSAEPSAGATEPRLPKLKPREVRAALHALLLGAFSRELPYAGAYRAWKEAVLSDAELAKMQAEIERWTTARVAAVFEALVRLPGARKDVNVPVLARLMDHVFWDLLGLALALPTPELRAVLSTTVDLLYHTLFTDPGNSPPR